MGAKTVVGSGPYSNVKDVHTLREKLSGTHCPFVPVQGASCAAEDGDLSAVAFLFAEQLPLPLRRTREVTACRPVRRIMAESSDVQLHRPRAAPEPIPQPNFVSLHHPSSYGRARAACTLLPPLGLCSTKLMNVCRCQFALSCSELSLPSNLLPLCVIEASPIGSSEAGASLNARCFVPSSR